MACDQQILDHVGDAYRRFRNTYRFLLGELEGQFEPAVDMVPVDELTGYDKAVLARLCEVHDTVTRAYDEYRFNVVFRTLYDFVITELSNGYLNATKDRMYCDAVASHARRSCQTVWTYLLSMLVRDMQPILAFTTDEVLNYLPESLRGGAKYAALLDWFENPMTPEQVVKYLPAYEALVEVRAAYTKAYEQALTAGVVTEKTTQATKARVIAPAATIEALTGAGAPDVAEALVCSSVEFDEGDVLSVEVLPADGEKCPRCWNWRELEEDGLCPRCHGAVAEYEHTHEH
jgi:isoleucyl-tRNA synthetase